MTIRNALLASTVMLVAAPPIAAQDSTWTQAQVSAWTATQARWQAWQADDFDVYLSSHHDTWHRWALRTEGLEGKDDVGSFWQRAKGTEATSAFSLDPVAIAVYGDGQFAAVHYVADETIQLLQDRVNREGQRVPGGTETHILIRFSDFLVREGEDWLFVGGYRDGSCALFRGLGRLCGE